MKPFLEMFVLTRREQVVVVVLMLLFVSAVLIRNLLL
jgi:hypothetical protein